MVGVCMCMCLLVCICVLLGIFVISGVVLGRLGELRCM